MKTFSDLKLNEAVQKLNQLGDIEQATLLQKIANDNPSEANKSVNEISFGLFDAPWKIKEHAYGFFDKENIVDGKIPLVNAISMSADQTLKGTRVNIRIGNIYTERYPGIFGGAHQILFDFKAKHAPSQAEEEMIRYSQKYTLRNGEASSTQGTMVVLGLTIPRNGIDFALNTIYLENESEQKLLRFMDTDTFKGGLKLLNSVNPIVSQISGYANGITKFLVDEKKNMVVQPITIGFDFSNSSEVASLKLGTYVAIQVKRDELDWAEWCYDQGKSLIVNRQTGKRLECNFITFVVSAYDGGE